MAGGAFFNGQMQSRPPWSVCLSGLLLIALSLWIKPILHAGFRAGASAVDIAPQSWPVRVNAMFTERNADHVEDALWAKSLSLGHLIQARFNVRPEVTVWNLVQAGNA